MYNPIKIAGEALTRQQRRAATWLTNRTLGYSRRRKLAGLILFCLLSAAFCIYLIIATLFFHLKK